MPESKDPLYRNSPIAKISSLAAVLATPEPELIDIINRVDEYHKPGKLLFKKNGERRPTHDAKEPLKAIHGRILSRILRKVDYPYYMLGGISDPENPRSPKAHAKIHTGKKILISEDIADFYPNTTYEVVKRIWQHCFDFPSEIAEALATLTTGVFQDS